MDTALNIIGRVLGIIVSLFLLLYGYFLTSSPTGSLMEKAIIPVFVAMILFFIGSCVGNRRMSATIFLVGLVSVWSALPILIVGLAQQREPSDGWELYLLAIALPATVASGLLLWSRRIASKKSLFCQHCNRALEKHARYCRYCGSARGTRPN